MANVTKTKSGKYKFVVTSNYKQVSKTFATKAEGYLWESDVKAGKDGVKRLKFSDLLSDYRDKVSIKKKGERWERIRIEMFLRNSELVDIDISELSRSHFAKWRDKRLLEVSADSVLREWCLLSHCLQIAVNEWELLTVNPMKGLAKPKKSPARERLPTQDEIDRLCFALNYSHNATLETVISRVGAAMMFAIETAFRAQEICNLEWDDVDGRVAKVRDSKTQAGIREVPLSLKAMAILNQCKGLHESSVFNINTSQLDSLFRKAKRFCIIDGLHFHDFRAEAITRLASKLDILELAKMIGHKDLSMLQVYYRKSTKELVSKLD